MRRETENMLLLIVGVALVMVTVTGAYTRYVKVAMLPWLAASAGVLIALALIAIARDIRGGQAHEHDGHHHHRNGIVWLLVVPVVLLIFVVPPALSAPRDKAGDGQRVERPLVSAAAGRAGTDGAAAGSPDAHRGRTGRWVG